MFNQPKPAEQKTPTSQESKDQMILDQQAQATLKTLEDLIKQKFELQQPLYFNKEGNLVCHIKDKEPMKFPALFHFLRLAKLDLPAIDAEKIRKLEGKFNELQIKDDNEIRWKKQNLVLESRCISRWVKN